MAEFVANNARSEFADKDFWNDRRKETVLKRLCSIIETRKSKGFCLSVRKNDYDAVIPDRLRPIIGTFHYTYAIRAVLGQIEIWRNENNIKEPIEYIFDNMMKGPERDEVERIFAQGNLEEKGRDRFGIYDECYSFRRRQEILPLQAADIVAWMCQRSWAHEDGRSDMPLYAIERWNRFLLRGLKAKWQRRDQLQEFVDKDPKPLVVLPDDWKPPSRTRTQ